MTPAGARRPRLTARRVVAVSVAGVALGCGSSFPAAPVGKRPPWAAQGVPVEFPPPPAQVEETGERPAADCVWADGHQAWTGRSWAWVSGGWVRVPSGCWRSEPALLWLPAEPSPEDGDEPCIGEEGRWLFRRGEWSWTDGIQIIPRDACPSALPPRLYFLAPAWYSATRTCTPTRCDGDRNDDG